MQFSDIIGESWTEQLNPYLNSKEFYDLGMFISSIKSLIPQKKDIFTAFKEVPYNDVKVVILGQIPYKTSNKANGRAFSINVDTLPITTSESLLDIVKQIEREEGLYLDPDHSLKGWSDQGVLLINQSMTCTPKDNHYNQWRTFIEMVIKVLSKRSDIIFLFIGDDNNLHPLIGAGNYRIHSNDFKGDCLYKVNAALYMIEQKEIKWNIPNYS
jgi:uracil-DNA glycosylase